MIPNTTSPQLPVLGWKRINNSLLQISNNSYNVTAILTKVKSRGLRNVGRHPAVVKMVHRKLILGRNNPLPFDRFAALVQLRNVPVRIDEEQLP